MRRHPWLVVALLAVVGVLVLAAFPARAYLNQVHQREELATRVQTLAAANEELAAQSQQLQSDQTIEQLARQRYHLVRPGEEAFAILPDGRAPAPPVAAVAASSAEPAQSWWSRTWAKITSIF